MSEALDELLVALFLDPHELPADVPAADSDEQLPLTGDPVLEPWVREALRLIEAGRVEVSRLPASVGRAVGLEGPNSDFVLELLALVARALADRASERAVVETRVERLVQAAKIEAGHARAERRPTRKLSRIARTAVRAVDQATVDIDPRLHAEALLALGGTYTFERDRRLDKAFPLYVRALQLFRAAPAPDHASDLQNLIARMIDGQLGGSRGASVLGGRDVAPAGLEAALDAATAIGRDDLVAAVAVDLSRTYSAVNRPDRAETMLRDVIVTTEVTDEPRLDLQSELAAAISEQDRFAEALRLQAEVVDGWRRRGAVPGIELLRLGNFQRETGDLAGAVESFEQALAMTASPEPDTVDMHRVHVQALLGQARVLQGDRTGLDLLDEAVAASGPLPSIGLLHLHRIMLDTAWSVGDGERARRALRAARAIQRHHLRRAPEFDVWDGLLGGWAPFDFAEVELALGEGGDGPAAALIAAETAKGRILRWAASGFTAEAAERVIADEQGEREVEVVQRWLDASGAGRRVISLFAAVNGFGAVTLRPGADIEGQWLDDLAYPELAVDVFDPWVELLAAASAGDRGAWKAAGIATDYLLRWVGELLWRAVPDLADGGDELVLLPHRILRVLPLWAATLPGGARLGELFGQVTVLPDLEELVRRIDVATSTPRDASVLAFADPDGSLPFAQLEAFEVAGPGATVGADVTRAAVHDGLSSPPSTIVHLACHGDFDDDNPWNSVIHAADGDLRLHELLLDEPGVGPVVVLGACEAGRTHRAPSDEPFGFPALLLRRGAAAVVAPSWQVDDLASLLLLTELYRRRRAQPTAAALVAAATWLRDLPAGGALARLDELGRDRVVAAADGGTSLRRRFDVSRAWLRDLPARERPFRSPLDWAAFQMTGVPTTPPTV